jgi:ABC-type branched-subunit amino acid transport system substrate-binding protein
LAIGATRSLLWSSALAVQLGCAGAADRPADAIAIGALLPFTGTDSAIGNNLEQAMLLAAEDINAAGGVSGRPLVIVSRDSNSGSARGFNQLIELLYTEQVPYLVGPEETQLASQIVPDLKALDVLNVLPGYTAPSIARISSRGAWLRLAPSPAAIGCGLATRAIQDGAHTANALVTLDDFNTSLAGEFDAALVYLGGQPLPSITVETGQQSYLTDITSAFGFGADRTLLIAQPATASTIVTDWTVSSRQGKWQLAPMLEAKAFLLNIPFGALDGYSGLSPSLSLLSECVTDDLGAPGNVACMRLNAGRFIQHFVQRWGGPPFPAAHFYYDAVVLLGMGLQYALAKDGALPSAATLQGYIRTSNVPTAGIADWSDLEAAMAQLARAVPLRYRGAAAEYSFDRYGTAQQVILDTWRVDQDSFIDTGPVRATCPLAE